MYDTPMQKIMPGEPMGATALNALGRGLNANRQIQGSEQVLVREVGGARAVEFIPGENLPGMAIFQCLVKADGGGVNGTTTTVATLTYTVCDPLGNPIAYALSPECNAARITFGPVTLPSDYSAGVCYIDLQGAIHLWMTKETRLGTVCT